MNVTQPAYHDRVLSFAELANRFSKKNLDSLSREEVIEICNKAISDANISAVFENAFAMDCETLNQLQRDAKSQYGEDFYMAPGSEYLSNEDGTGKWNVTQWEKEQEAYYVVYRMQLNGRTLDTTGSLCYIDLCCGGVGVGCGLGCGLCFVGLCLLLASSVARVVHCACYWCIFLNMDAFAVCHDRSCAV